MIYFTSVEFSIDLGGFFGEFHSQLSGKETPLIATLGGGWRSNNLLLYIIQQYNALGVLLLMLNTYESFCIVGNHIVGYADDTSIYTVFPRQLSCTQVKESLNQNLAAIYSSCLKWHMRLNHNKTKLAGLGTMLSVIVI